MTKRAAAAFRQLAQYGRWLDKRGMKGFQEASQDWSLPIRDFTGSARITKYLESVARTGVAGNQPNQR